MNTRKRGLEDASTVPFVNPRGGSVLVRLQADAETELMFNFIEVQPCRMP